MTRILVGFLLTLSLSGRAQVTISGFIQDSVTHQNLPFANVFLANTTRGTTTDATGRFTLKNVPLGTFDLLVSHIGYQLYRTVVLAKQDVTLTVQLRPQAQQLSEVVVRSRRRRSAPDDYRKFEALFLGESSFSRDCRILNPDEVWVEYQTAGNVLRAESTGHLIIENSRLGYRVSYYGLTFQCDFTQQTMTYVGWPIFEEMRPRNVTQERRWDQNRRLAYQGSLPHFLRSLRQNRLNEEGFLVHRLRQLINPRRRYADSLVKSTFEAGGVRALLAQDNPDDQQLAQMQREPEYVTKLSLRPSPIDSLRWVQPDSNRVWLQFRDRLYVIYEREKPDAKYRPDGVPDAAQLPPALRARNGQVSVLELLVPRAEIDSDGHLDNPLAILNQGYWGFEGMGEFLPLDYVLPSPTFNSPLKNNP